MSDATRCGEAGCTAEVFVRGFCRIHYHRHYRAGTLPDRQLELPIGVHSLSNVDADAKTADCAVCGPAVRIRVRSRKGRGGFECRSTHNRGRLTPEVRRQRRLKAEYGLSVAEYQAMYDEQNGRCAICDAEFALLCVDHCHTTGRVRGLLCTSCNTALGHLRDDPIRLERAISYLNG